VHPGLFPFVLDYPEHAEPRVRPGPPAASRGIRLPRARDPPLLEATDGVAEPGAFALLPRGSQHAFVVTSHNARLLTLHHPAGFEDFVIEVGTPAPELIPPSPLDGPPPPELVEALTAAASRHGITIGPPPQP
jgi:hypothetical protein